MDGVDPRNRSYFCYGSLREMKKSNTAFTTCLLASSPNMNVKVCKACKESGNTSAKTRTASLHWWRCYC